jgi:PAS domain S-box-containing protein
MNADRLARLRYLVMLWISGCIALGAVTWACFALQCGMATSSFIYLIVIVLLSFLDSFVSSTIFSVFSAGCLNYFFTEPLFSFRVAHKQDLLALATFLITSHAITALVRHTRRLGEAHREQARLLDLTHDTILVTDMNRVISYWNRGAEELYGWKREEAVGKVSHQLLQTIFPVALDDINEQLSRTGRWEGELIHTKRDGSKVVVASRWSLQRSESGRPLATLVTNNDISERRRAEDELRRSQAEYLAEAQGLSLTGSFGWRVSNGELFWSDQSFRIFGYDPGTTPSLEMVLQRTHPDDVAGVKQLLEHSASTGRDFDFQHRLLMPDGSIKHLHVVAHAVIDEQGNQKFVGAIQDITAARLADEQLREAQTELARMSRVTALGELSASIAHEVNQPLAAIVTSGGACLRWLGHATPQPDEVRACVQNMMANGKRAAEIVRRIRTFTKRDTPQKTHLGLNEVVNEVASLVQHQVLTHRVTLRIKLAPGLPSLAADRIELQQVILNLVINGIQAIDETDDELRELLIETRQDEDGWVVVAVQDSGPGIKAENVNHLFDPFFTTKSDGMGMGLSICRSIIEAHGGRVWASSHAARGAVFQCSLPALGESGLPAPARCRSAP